MIFFKNFLFLLLTTALFSQENFVTSQEIISTDSPEELIGNEVHTYDSLNAQNLEEIETQMQTTIETINTNVNNEENSPIVQEQTNYPTVDETTPPSTQEASPELSFKEAIQRAKDEHKVILLEISETGCKYCEKMENEVFPTEKVVNELNDDFIILRINGDEQELPLGLSLQMTPMHVFVSENEDIKDMTFGFLEADDFLELLNKEKN